MNREVQQTAQITNVSTIITGYHHPLLSIFAALADVTALPGLLGLHPEIPAELPPTPENILRVRYGPFILYLQPPPEEDGSDAVVSPPYSIPRFPAQFSFQYTPDFAFLVAHSSTELVVGCFIETFSHRLSLPVSSQSTQHATHQHHNTSLHDSSSIQHHWCTNCSPTQSAQHWTNVTELNTAVDLCHGPVTCKVNIYDLLLATQLAHYQTHPSPHIQQLFVQRVLSNTSFDRCYEAATASAASSSDATSIPPTKVITPSQSDLLETADLYVTQDLWLRALQQQQSSSSSSILHLSSTLEEPHQALRTSFTSVSGTGASSTTSTSSVPYAYSTTEPYQPEIYDGAHVILPPSMFDASTSGRSYLSNRQQQYGDYNNNTTHHIHHTTGGNTTNTSSLGQKNNLATTDTQLFSSHLSHSPLAPNRLFASSVLPNTQTVWVTEVEATSTNTISRSETKNTDINTSNNTSRNQKQVLWGNNVSLRHLDYLCALIPASYRRDATQYNPMTSKLNQPSLSESSHSVYDHIKQLNTICDGYPTAIAPFWIVSTVWIPVHPSNNGNKHEQQQQHQHQQQSLQQQQSQLLSSRPHSHATAPGSSSSSSSSHHSSSNHSSSSIPYKGEHSVLLILLSTGHIITLCPLSLRIIQIQHLHTNIKAVTIPLDAFQEPYDNDRKSIPFLFKPNPTKRVHLTTSLPALNQDIKHLHCIQISCQNMLYYPWQTTTFSEISSLPNSTSSSITSSSSSSSSSSLPLSTTSLSHNSNLGSGGGRATVAVSNTQKSRWMSFLSYFEQMQDIPISISTQHSTNTLSLGGTGLSLSIHVTTSKHIYIYDIQHIQHDLSQQLLHPSPQGSGFWPVVIIDLPNPNPPSCYTSFHDPITQYCLLPIPFIPSQSLTSVLYNGSSLTKAQQQCVVEASSSYFTLTNSSTSSSSSSPSSLITTQQSIAPYFSSIAGDFSSPLSTSTFLHNITPRLSSSFPVCLTLLPHHVDATTFQPMLLSTSFAPHSNYSTRAELSLKIPPPTSLSIACYGQQHNLEKSFLFPPKPRIGHFLPPIDRSFVYSCFQHEQQQELNIFTSSSPSSLSSSSSSSSSSALTTDVLQSKTIVISHAPRHMLLFRHHFTSLHEPFQQWFFPLANAPRILPGPYDSNTINTNGEYLRGFAPTLISHLNIIQPDRIDIQHETKRASFRRKLVSAMFNIASWFYGGGGGSNKDSTEQAEIPQDDVLIQFPIFTAHAEHTPVSEQLEHAIGRSSRSTKAVASAQHLLPLSNYDFTRHIVSIAPAPTNAMIYMRVPQASTPQRTSTAPAPAPAGAPTTTVTKLFPVLSIAQMFRMTLTMPFCMQISLYKQLLQQIENHHQQLAIVENANNDDDDGYDRDYDSNNEQANSLQPAAVTTPVQFSLQLKQLFAFPYPSPQSIGRPNRASKSSSQSIPSSSSSSSSIDTIAVSPHSLANRSFIHVQQLIAHQEDSNRYDHIASYVENEKTKAIMGWVPNTGQVVSSSVKGKDSSSVMTISTTYVNPVGASMSAPIRHESMEFGGGKQQSTKQSPLVAAATQQQPNDFLTWQGTPRTSLLACVDSLHRVILLTADSQQIVALFKGYRSPRCYWSFLLPMKSSITTTAQSAQGGCEYEYTFYDQDFPSEPILVIVSNGVIEIWKISNPSPFLSSTTTSTQLIERIHHSTTNHIIAKPAQSLLTLGLSPSAQNHSRSLCEKIGVIVLSAHLISASSSNTPSQATPKVNRGAQVSQTSSQLLTVRPTVFDQNAGWIVCDTYNELYPIPPPPCMRFHPNLLNSNALSSHRNSQQSQKQPNIVHASLNATTNVPPVQNTSTVSGHPPKQRYILSNLTLVNTSGEIFFISVDL